MKRRDFIAGLGTAAAWPIAARGQGERIQRVGVLFGLDENDPEAKRWLSQFVSGLAELGWIEGRNMRLDVRSGGGSLDRIRTLAKELVDSRPDVVLSTATPTTAALKRETQTIPIVFAIVADPVGEGFVANLARPAGNITGFINREAATSGKLLELLAQIAPQVRRAIIIFNPDTAAGHGSYYLSAFEAAARSLNIDSAAIPVRSDDDIRLAIAPLEGPPKGGLVVAGDAFVLAHRDSIISLTAQHKIPSIFDAIVYVKEGA
jgi:putative ABC transport system substrate-binding protein